MSYRNEKQTVWQRISLGETILENQKSKIQVNKANGGSFVFFTSGDTILNYGYPIISGENLFLSTGGVANLKYFNGNCAYSTDTYSIRSKGSNRFLYYFLLSNLEYINENYFSGSGLKHLQKSSLKSHIISLPPIKEQQAIAEILTNLEDVITKTKEIIKKQKLIKQGLMQDLLTNGIDEKGNCRSLKTHKYEESELGLVPEEWEVENFTNRFVIQSGQVNPRIEPFSNMVLVAPDHIEQKTGILLGKVTASEQGATSGKYLFHKGDVIYSKIRPYLRKAILVDFDGICSADMYPLKAKSNLNSYFLFLIILGEKFSIFAEQTSVRSGFPKINRSEMSEFKMAFPNLSEQTRIVEIIEAQDNQIQAEEKQLAKYEKIKKGLMNDLLTGKVRLPEFQIQN